MFYNSYFLTLLMEGGRGVGGEGRLVICLMALGQSSGNASGNGLQSRTNCQVRA